MHEIRLAKKEDMPFIVAMCEKFYSFTDASKIKEFSHSALYRLVDSFISSDYANCFVCGDNIPIACAGMTAMNHPFTDDFLIVSEVFWWVEPDHRNKGIGKDLIRYAENWGKSIGAAASAMAHTAEIEPKKARETYEKLGYKQAEHSYWKILRECT